MAQQRQEPLLEDLVDLDRLLLLLADYLGLLHRQLEALALPHLLLADLDSARLRLQLVVLEVLRQHLSEPHQRRHHLELLRLVDSAPSRPELEFLGPRHLLLVVSLDNLRLLLLVDCLVRQLLHPERLVHRLLPLDSLVRLLQLLLVHRLRHLVPLGRLAPLVHQLQLRSVRIFRLLPSFCFVCFDFSHISLLLQALLPLHQEDLGSVLPRQHQEDLDSGELRLRHLQLVRLELRHLLPLVRSEELPQLLEQSLLPLVDFLEHQLLPLLAACLELL